MQCCHFPAATLRGLHHMGLDMGLDMGLEPKLYHGSIPSARCSAFLFKGGNARQFAPLQPFQKGTACG